MKKEFLINIILLIAINFLIKPIYLFGIETEAQNIVGLSEWGKYYELFTLCFLFGFIHDPGLLSYNTKTVSEKPSLLQFMFTPILGSKLILGSLFLIVASIGFFILGYELQWYKLMLMIATSQFLGSFYLLQRSNVAGTGNYRFDSFFSALDKLLMLVIVGILVYTPSFRTHFSIMSLALGQCLSLLLANLIIYLFITKKVKEKFPSFSLLYVRNLVKQTLPYGILMIVMAAYSKIDGVMLGRLLDDNNYQVGLYGACYRILDALNMIGNIFGALLVSMFASLIGKRENVAELLELSLRLMIFISISAFAIITRYSADLLPLLYDDYTIQFTQVLIPLIAGFIFLSMAYIVGALLTANGNVKSMNKLFLAGIILNILLNLYLIPRYEAYGASIATLITEAIMLIGLIIIARSKLMITYSSRLISQVFLFVLCATLVHFAMGYLEIEWTLGLVVNSVLILLIGVVSGLISLKETRQLLRK